MPTSEVSRCALLAGITAAPFVRGASARVVAHRLVQVMVRHTAHPVGQFAHGRHAQIARRVISSHHFGIAEIPKSVTHSAPSRLDTRDVTANRHET
jgi:hypothetical protein